jgi:hypothetical protein
MIDVLYSKLKACNDVSLAEWKDIEPRIYSKHSQAPLNNLVSNVIPEAAKAAKALKEIKVSASTTDETKVAAKALKDTSDANAATKLTKKKPVKDTGVKPLDIIMTETISLNNSTEHIKDALITLISKEEFSKVFGLTKCAEIMSGVVNNRWNKSTALFISFLLDKEVYYNEKISLYNKEKNRGRITIP